MSGVIPRSRPERSGRARDRDDSPSPPRVEIRPVCAYFSGMGLPHPSLDQISLPNVLSALGDDTRLAIVGILARNEGTSMTCGQFYDLGSKTSLSYHLAKLREAGVVRVEPSGTSRLISLRRADLDERFPGFIDSVIATAVNLPLVLPKDDAAE